MRTLVVVLQELNALPREERQRVLGVLRTFFPGDWPADLALSDATRKART